MNERPTFLRSIIQRVDFSILVPSILLVLISLSAIYSLDSGLARQQLFFSIFSIFTYFVFLNIDYRIFSSYARHIYFVSLIILFFVLVIGTEVRGAVRWIEIAGISFQFSEILKPFFLISFASFVSSARTFSFSNFIKLLLLILPFFILIVRQPDFGNALIYLIVSILILLFTRFPIFYFLGLGALLSLLAPLLARLLHEYQKQRIASFLNIGEDPLGSSYNAIQSLISIGSGGVFGKGFSESTQSIFRFLPERHTDFIFATISESMGFVGSFFVILIYGFLLYRVYKISRGVEDTFSYLVTIGSFFLILIHVLFNIGMNIGLLPVVGVTLPLLSYGGSSILSNFITIGILSSISFETRGKHSIEIR